MYMLNGWTFEFVSFYEILLREYEMLLRDLEKFSVLMLLMWYYYKVFFEIRWVKINQIQSMKLI
jgi:hypothetical protein